LHVGRDLRVADSLGSWSFASTRHRCGCSAPPTELEATVCIHGRLVFEIDGRRFPVGARPFRGEAGFYDNECLRDWVARLIRAEGELEDARPAPGAPSVRHPPGWGTFERRGSRAFVLDPARNVHASCDAEELRVAIGAFLDSFRGLVVAAHPDGERWWRDATERAVHARRLMGQP
jgi:hypothetical protein